MKASKSPFLYSRNGIYYCRIQNHWKSLRTRRTKQAAQRLSFAMTGIEPNAILANKITHQSGIHISSKLIKDYLAENGQRWCEQEYRRVSNCLAKLPKGLMTKEKRFNLKRKP